MSNHQRRKLRKTQKLQSAIDTFQAADSKDAQLKTYKHIIYARIHDALEMLPRLMHPGGLHGACIAIYPEFKDLIANKSIVTFLTRDKLVQFIQQSNGAIKNPSSVLAMVDQVDPATELCFMMCIEGHFPMVTVLKMDDYRANLEAKSKSKQGKPTVVSEVKTSDAETLRQIKDKFQQLENLQNRKCSRADCSRFETLDQRFSRCARCGSVVYCCKECQKQDWKTHKATCVEINGAAATDAVPKSSGNLDMRPRLEDRKAGEWEAQTRDLDDLLLDNLETETFDIQESPFNPLCDKS